MIYNPSTSTSLNSFFIYSIYHHLVIARFLPCLIYYATRKSPQLYFKPSTTLRHVDIIISPISPVDITIPLNRQHHHLRLYIISPFAVVTILPRHDTINTTISLTPIDTSSFSHITFASVLPRHHHHNHNHLHHLHPTPRRHIHIHLHLHLYPIFHLPSTTSTTSTTSTSSITSTLIRIPHIHHHRQPRPQPIPHHHLPPHLDHSFATPSHTRDTTHIDPDRQRHINKLLTPNLPHHPVYKPTLVSYYRHVRSTYFRFRHPSTCCIRLVYFGLLLHQ